MAIGKPERSKKKYYNLTGCFGLFGLLGFKYFFTGNPGDLFFFASFAFFAAFVLGNINREFPDERWLRNSYLAGRNAFFVAAFSVFLIGFAAALHPVSREFVIVAAAAGWVASTFTYAVLFRTYERA